MVDIFDQVKCNTFLQYILVHFTKKKRTQIHYNAHTNSLIYEIRNFSVFPQPGYWSHDSSPEAVVATIPSLCVYTSAHVGVQHDIALEEAECSSCVKKRITISSRL